MFPPGGPGGMMPPGLNTGPSPDFMQKMKQGMSKNGKKKQPQLPINGPKGMTPATSIMQTGNAAPNPYAGGDRSSTGHTGIVRGPTQMPMPLAPTPPTSVVPMGGPQMGSMGAPQMGGSPMGQGQVPPFWNMYNQNRPQMMG